MRESVRQPVKKKPVAMKPFAALLALGLVCGAAAANVTCVATPAEFVANLETIGYQQLDRPNVAATGKASAPPDNASVAYDLKYLLSVDQRLQRMETTGTFWGTWTDYRLAFDEERRRPTSPTRPRRRS